MSASIQIIEDSAKVSRSVAAILACHNRRELTLRALRALKAQADIFDLSVVLFDDGSTDGTAEAVSAQFPETIILSGNGDAYWNGGMHRAWSRALKLQPDAYLWLNDDVELDGDALQRLNQAWMETEEIASEGAVILVGATCNSKGRLTYGAMRHQKYPFAFRLERLPKSDKMERADTMNGNIVLVTAPVVDQIGILDLGYFHMYGDIDYGLRATRAGTPVLQLAGTLGVCEANPGIDLSTLGLRARWRYILNSPRGIMPASWWRLVNRFSGVWAPLHFMLPYRKLFFPARWLQ